jgi:endonuclease/exonuclease/phosphatase family metal-dependent hydrolase
MSFVIGTWNVQWQFGDWEERQPAIADVLRTLDADVIMARAGGRTG